MILKTLFIRSKASGLTYNDFDQRLVGHTSIVISCRPSLETAEMMRIVRLVSAANGLTDLVPPSTKHYEIIM